MSPYVIANTVSTNSQYSIATSYSINSAILNEERTFYVSLPKSYNKGNAGYPVLILLDGEQNIEHSVASARMLANWRGIPEVIIVAIKSKRRVKDFTPSQDLSYSKDSGGASLFAKFIEKELMQFVDNTYRTHPYRILEGHSFGGTFALSQLLKNNPYFNAYIVIGPALWWNSRELISYAESSWQPKRGSMKPLSLSIGELDGYGMKQDIKRFNDILKSRYLDETLLNFQIFSNEGHMSATLPSVYEGLVHVFKEAKYSKELWHNFTSNGFKQFIANTNAIYGPNAKQSGELLIELSQTLIEKGDYSGAITVLKENLVSYPENLFNYEELAHAYVLNDQPTLAIEQYNGAIKAAQQSTTSRVGQITRYKAAINVLEHPVTYTLDELKSFEGCFQSDSGKIFTFMVENGHLIGKRKGWINFRLFSTKKDHFMMRVQPRLELKFERNNVIFNANGIEYIYKRLDCID